MEAFVVNFLNNTVRKPVKIFQTDPKLWFVNNWPSWASLVVNCVAGDISLDINLKRGVDAVHEIRSAL